MEGVMKSKVTTLKKDWSSNGVSTLKFCSRLRFPTSSPVNTPNRPFNMWKENRLYSGFGVSSVANNLPVENQSRQIYRFPHVRYQNRLTHTRRHTRTHSRAHKHTDVSEVCLSGHLIIKDLFLLAASLSGSDTHTHTVPWLLNTHTHTHTNTHKHTQPVVWQCIDSQCCSCAIG